jgi:hypothetical protein
MGLDVSSKLGWKRSAIQFLDGADSLNGRPRWLRPRESKTVASMGDDRGHGDDRIVWAAVESYKIVAVTGDGGA